jgi:serine/threonine protein kinase/Tol biopolymer transport system component
LRPFQPLHEVVLTDAAQRLSTALADRYHLERELGQGGMATVYLAEDLKHGRKVAIKVLHPELSAVIGGERFLSEIKTTASLQHPHILGLIDSGEADGLLYYVMPFIEGETLRARLSREKQLPVDDAVRLTREVASALEFAHKRGIVHRDIKPENILLQDGQALVADFGIALAVQQAGGSRMTQTGMSLGTPAYMSPEQAMGEREIGARSDVYALGAMTYEMLTGEPPFMGPNSQAIVAKVLTEQPPALRPKRPLVTAAVESAVLTALQKLPADRFGSAKDFADALDGKGGGTYAATVQMASRPHVITSSRRGRALALVAAAALISAIGTWAVMRNGRTGATTPSRYQLNLPGLQRSNLRYSGSSVALSPDGRRIGYIRASTLGVRTVWVLEQPFGEPRQLAGTENVDALFFSPDGNALAFFADGKLLRVPFAGGRPVFLADSMSRDLATGVWRADGTLLVNDGVYNLRSIPEGGGPSTLVAKAPSAIEALNYPELLPDPDKLLVTRCSANCGLMNVGTLNLRTGESATLVKNAARAWYLPPGRLLYVMQDGAAMMVGFDPDAMKMSGTPRQVFSDVRLNLAIAPQLALTADGRQILYIGGTSSGSQRQVRIVRVNEKGQAAPVDSTWEGVFNYSDLSPDGTRLALTVFSDERQNLWVKALDRGPITRLTFEGAVNYRPTWLANGREIAFISDQTGPALPYVVRADGSGKPERIAVPDTAQIDEIEFAPGGEWIVYRRGTVNGNRRLAMFRPGVDSTPKEISAGRFDEYAPTVSPDGRWLAYVSVESGRDEVYIRPFPDVSRARWQVSTTGGSSPVWSSSGKALYFVSATDQLLKMDVAGGSDFQVAVPQVMFSTNPFLLAPYHQSFNISADGQSFIFAQPVNPSASEEYATVLLDWLQTTPKSP